MNRSRAGRDAAARRAGGAALLLAVLAAPGFAAAPETKVSPPVAAADFGLDAAAALDASRAAVGRRPADYVFRDRDDRERRMSEYRGRPLLVNFIYSGCYKVCPNTSRALRTAVVAMRERFGSDQFTVLSIGFDQPGDSPTALRAFAAQHGIDDRNWQFLSPRAEDVPALARDFGFRFVATPMGFDHTLQVSIVDAEGVIRRQVVGDSFAADSLGEPLKQLIGGGLVSGPGGWSDLLDRVRILCSVYDPETGRYRADYGLYIEIAGGLTFIIAMLWFALAEWRTQRTARRSARQ